MVNACHLPCTMLLTSSVAVKFGSQRDMSHPRDRIDSQIASFEWRVKDVRFKRVSVTVSNKDLMKDKTGYKAS